eukprot:18026-Lingulodinium_polyedra.AAC.1
MSIAAGVVVERSDQKWEELFASFAGAAGKKYRLQDCAVRGETEEEGGGGAERACIVAGSGGQEEDSL